MSTMTQPWTPTSAANVARAVPAVFLDRDGVINVEKGYVHRLEDFVFLDGVMEAARRLSGLGYPLVVVTNQSGIGRGYYSEQDFHQVNEWMLGQFLACGVRIAGVYYCPHSPEAGCACRKPAPGLFFRAAGELSLDLARSWMVGDKAADVEAARAAGIPHRILVRSGHRLPPFVAAATSTCETLAEVLPLIEKLGLAGR